MQTFPLEWGVLKSSVIFSVPLSKSFTESGVEELPDLIGIHMLGYMFFYIILTHTAYVSL